MTKRQLCGMIMAQGMQMYGLYGAPVSRLNWWA
nr:MAG TPA: hypothetical protein [Caudoviricetes sp.]